MPRALSIAIGLLMLLLVIGATIWFLIRTLKRTEDPASLIFKWILSLIFTGLLLWFAAGVGFDNLGALGIPFACVLYGVAMSVLWAPHLGAILAKPFTSMFDGGDTPPDPQPLYSIAISRRKLGRYEEAVAHIREQLDKFPTDFAGQMMLAEIQAENLNDLPGAQITIQRICNQEGHTPSNITAALLQLADWQLKYWQDPDSARESLEEVRARFPDSEFAHVAAQRIAHLATREHLQATHDRPAIQLRTGPEDFGLRKDQSGLLPPEEDPGLKAAELVQHLEQHPLDCEVRERLAMIYAEHYQRLDYAVRELEQIIQQPGLATRQITRLLSLMADLHIKFGNDYDAARQCLQRILDQYPNCAAAEMARQRLGTLKLEMRGKQTSQSVPLGTYEQDIGLKKKL